MKSCKSQNPILNQPEKQHMKIIKIEKKISNDEDGEKLIMVYMLVKEIKKILCQ